MQKTICYPGSCGELIQGRLMERDLLLSCPVNLFTKVRVFECEKAINRFRYQKSSKLVENLLNKWGFEGELNSIDLEINSKIPRGRGFASSTADLCAVYRAMISIFNRQFDINELIEECINIEPTDSIIFDEMTLFDYKKGDFYTKLGNYLEFYILVFEGPSIVNTLSFNSMKLPPLSDISGAYEILKEGMQNKDIEKIANACTISIISNQHRLPYPIIDDILKIKDTTQGLGILGGHSGDVIGIIYDDKKKMNTAYEKYAYGIRGYKCYTLKTLRSVEYEDFDDYSAI